MDPLDNPYTPNAGANPPVLVGRSDELASFKLLLARLARGRSEQSMIITGLRGVGKTVLLGAFRKEAISAGWAVIEIEVSKHSDEDFRRQLAVEFRKALLEISPRAKWTDRARKAAGVLRSFTVSVDPEGKFTAGFDVDAVEGQADSGELGVDLTDLFLAVGEAARDHKTGLVLLFDEVQFLTKAQMEALIAALHKTVQRDLPITMVGAGLPQIAELAGEAKSYSERLFKFPKIGMLDDNDAVEAITRPALDSGVTFEETASAEAVRLTGGYPYFLQEMGSAVWNLANDETITAQDVTDAHRYVEEKLDGSFFRVRLDRTTELEQAYLRAMAQLGPEPQLASDVAALLNRTSQQVSPTRSQLIDKGLLYTPNHGYAAFTVPHFDRFMMRAVPELSVPELRQRRGRHAAS
ncbi:ATP-binding protein [Pseudarthrobacter sp. LT1]|uniref:ATP-binding protein n=1 Tax=Pseudarthrobacter sp. LT1 TaxID=3111450 RepID=UPI002D768C0C|nr:ATP-binding protein [Pseudarthrobacter sp. LT1]WRT12502.1 ATP-binding protein [Pseudarthrobacter sp. LT1]